MMKVVTESKLLKELFFFDKDILLRTALMIFPDKDYMMPLWDLSVSFPFLLPM